MNMFLLLSLSLILPCFPSQKHKVFPKVPRDHLWPATADLAQSTAAGTGYRRMRSAHTVLLVPVWSAAVESLTEMTEIFQPGARLSPPTSPSRVNCRFTFFLLLLLLTYLFLLLYYCINIFTIIIIIIIGGFFYFLDQRTKFCSFLTFSLGCESGRVWWRRDVMAQPSLPYRGPGGEEGRSGRGRGGGESRDGRKSLPEGWLRCLRRVAVPGVACAASEEELPRERGEEKSKSSWSREQVGVKLCLRFSQLLKRREARGGGATGAAAIRSQD